MVDVLISGLSDPCVRSKPLNHDVTLILEKAVNIARTQEAAIKKQSNCSYLTFDPLRHGPHAGQTCETRLPGQG